MATHSRIVQKFGWRFFFCTSLSLSWCVVLVLFMENAAASAREWREINAKLHLLRARSVEWEERSWKTPRRCHWNAAHIHFFFFYVQFEVLCCCCCWWRWSLFEWGNLYIFFILLFFSGKQSPRHASQNGDGESLICAWNEVEKEWTKAKKQRAARRRRPKTTT